MEETMGKHEIWHLDKTGTVLYGIGVVSEDKKTVTCKFEGMEEVEVVLSTNLVCFDTDTVEKKLLEYWGGKEAEAKRGLKYAREWRKKFQSDHCLA
jgi:hypothetical protein